MASKDFMRSTRRETIVIAGYVGISLILWGAVRLFFKDLPLDDADESEDESNG